MQLEIFKGEDDILVEALYKLMRETTKTDKVKTQKVFRLINRIFLQNQLYQNMYGRDSKIQCCQTCKHLVSCDPNPFGVCEEYEEQNNERSM